MRNKFIEVRHKDVMVSICNEHQCSRVPVAGRCDCFPLNSRKNREAGPNISVTFNETVVCSKVLGLCRPSSSTLFFESKLGHFAGDVESERSTCLIINVEGDQMHNIPTSQRRQKEGLIDRKVRDLERNTVSRTEGAPVVGG